MAAVGVTRFWNVRCRDIPLRYTDRIGSRTILVTHTCRMNMRAATSNVQALAAERRPLQPMVNKSPRRARALKKQKQISAWEPPLETRMADRGIPPKTDSNSHSKLLWHLYKIFFGWAAESFATVERTYETVGRMSALPPKADITAAQTNVRFVPIADAAPFSLDHSSARPSSKVTSGLATSIVDNSP